MTFSEVRLSRVARITLGKMLQSDQRSEGDVAMNYLRAAHIQPHGEIIDLDDGQQMWFQPSEVHALDLRQGDVVIVEGGAGFGRSAVLRESRPGWGFQNSIVRVRPIAGRLDGVFLSYALQSSLDERQIELTASTATIPHFTAEKVSAHPIPLPPFEEQQAIADFLDRETAKIDALIDKQQQLQAGLTQRRVSLVQTALADTETIPLKRLVDPSRPLTYGILQAGEPVADGVPYIGPSDIPNDGTSPRRTSLRTTSREIADQYKRSTLIGGDVVASIGPAYGRAMIASDELDGANLTQDTVRVALRTDRALPRFVLWSLWSPQAQRYWDEQISGATFRRLNLGTLGETPIPDIPLLQQLELVNQLDDATQQIDSLSGQCAKLIRLAQERRAALITAAVTGKIDVTTGKAYDQQIGED